MDTFEFEGQGYLAVSLIEGDEIQEGVYIYRYHNAEDGDVVVEPVSYTHLKQYSIKRMTGGRVIEANTDFYRYLICHLPSAGV